MTNPLQPLDPRVEAGPAPRANSPLRPRGTGIANLVAGMALAVAAMLSTTADASAEDRYGDSVAAIDKAYDEVAGRQGANPGGDGAARLGTLDALRRKLRPLASTLDDRASRLDGMRSKDQFLEREVESAEREVKRVDDGYIADQQPFLDELASLKAQVANHNAAPHQFTEEQAAALAAYDAEKADIEAKIADFVRRSEAFEERYKQPRQDAKDRLEKKRQDYSEHHDKFTDLLEKQHADADDFTGMLGQARGTAQGLGSANSAATPAVDRGGPAQPSAGDEHAQAPPKGDTDAMKELRSAAGHGRKAEAPDASLDLAREQASKVFDERGDPGVMVTPDAVAVPAGSGQDPVVPPERRTPQTDVLVRGLSEARHEQAVAEQQVAELKKQPPTPERDVKIVEAKIAASKAGNKINMKKFEIHEVLDKPPVPPDAAAAPAGK